MRTAETIAQQQEASHTENSKKSTSRRGQHLRPFHWKPGQSGNPGGRPKADVSRAIAKRIFEQNEEAAYVALGKALLKGNAYVFKELAERAYGKLPQHVTVTNTDAITSLINEGRQRVARRKAPTVQ